MSATSEHSEDAPMEPRSPLLCARCSVPMRQGKLVQNWQAGWQRISWCPNPDSIMGDLFRVNRTNVIAMRCPKCGSIELFAPGPR